MLPCQDLENHLNEFWLLRHRANETHVGPELKGKADAAIAAELEKAKAVLKKAGGIKGWLASL